MPGQVLKNLLIVLAPDVMEVGQVKPFHTTNPKGSVRIANIATPHEKAVVNQANVNTAVLALFILAKTKVGESQQLLLETWFLSVLMPGVNCNHHSVNHAVLAVSASGGNYRVKNSWG